MKRIRKKKLFFQFFQVIESDPEDDLLEQATRPKYSRGPEMSTPTYSMDTDISTLEAPTFSTLNKGPSQTMMSLRWDHQVNEMGRRVSWFFYFHPYHPHFLQFYFFISPNISIRQTPFSYFQNSRENLHSELLHSILQQQFHIKYQVKRPWKTF